MNFLAHCALALEHDPSPRFVLGSMLPDFAAMAGRRIGRLDDAVVAAGVRFHMSTDDAFHATRAFRDLIGWSRDELRAEGLPRASALAVSHVGAELFLDGWIAADRRIVEAYHDALELDALDAADDAWRPGRTSSPETDERSWREHRERLLASPLPDGYRDAGFVAARLAVILARRPLLRLDAAGERVVASHAASLRDRTWQHAERLLAQTRSTLQAAAAATTPE